MKTFEAGKTISELGIDTTRKFVVVSDKEDFKKGEILTLLRDTDTAYPVFKNENGEKYYIYLESLSYYEEKMKEGDYVYVSDESEEDAIKQKNKRILLKKCSDGVVCVPDRNEEQYQEGKTFDTIIWKNAVPIPKTKTITLGVTEEEEREINLLLKK